MLLTKKTYREVVKKLDHYRKQHEQDRQESPNAIPIDWASAIELMVENTCRQNGERYGRDHYKKVVAYLSQQGLLIPYHGGYTFPGTPIPTEQEVIDKVNQALGKINE